MNSLKEKYDQLIKLHKVLLIQNIPFASYRLPLNREIITVVQHHSMPERLESLNDLHEKIGFVVAPFTESPAHGTYFLQPECVFFSNDIADIYIEKLAANNRFVEIGKNKNAIKTTTSEEFIDNVNKAISAMKAAQFEKVVLSKVRVEQLPDGFQPEDFFLKLCQKYPHAFVYMMQFPEVGCWIGATPEPLITIENGRVKTVSLAGTQIATEVEIEDYRWSSKEIEEQGIVTNFVEQTLRSLQISNIAKTGPENYRAANLIHLKTAFVFPQADVENRFSELLKALHPTPSVGGLPKNEARDFILANEQHDRGYYTGFFGPVNINEKSAIFVNLRCLQLFDNNFVLYSGAGITSSSVAEREWEETDNKMLTLMNVMMTSKGG